MSTRYLIYCRKSTEDASRQILSLDSQENTMRQLADALNLNVVGVLKESKSAKEPGRPVFNELIKMIKAGKADAILCWKIDRLTRNPIDGGEIMWLLQKGVIQRIQTYEKEYLPSDNVLFLSLEQGNANQAIRDLSTNVKRGNTAKLDKGGWPNHAPFGYLNDKANKTIIVDPLLSKYVLRTYDLYLTGSNSLRDIMHTLYAEGLRTKAGKKVYMNQIQRILLNPFYHGITVRDGIYRQGSHPPLITKKMFDDAQDILTGRARPRTKKLFFPLSGFMSCEVCGCALTASTKKGHHYYYCTNRKEICNEHKSYMRETYLYEIFGNILDTIAFSERKIEIMYQAAKEKSGLDSEYIEKAMTTLQNELQSLKSKESRLLDAFLAEQIDKEVYDERILSMRNQAVSIQKQISDLKDKSPASMLEPVKNVFLQASRAKKEFLQGSDEQKRTILENLCWNLTFRDRNVAQLKLKSPFDVMVNMSKSGSISELLGE